MARPSAAEEAILLASDNATVADCLVKRGEAVGGSRFWDSISEEAEAALLERNDRLVNLRLAEYCFHPSTAQALFHRQPDDWAIRSLVLSNRQIAYSSAISGFPECLFDSGDTLRAYLFNITYDDASVLFANPTIDDRFLENVLALGDYWQAMREEARRYALRSLAFNPKMQAKPSLAEHPDDWYTARTLLGAAWRLVITLDANNYNAFDLAHLYENLAPDCNKGEGILEALPKWVPQNEEERERESKDNERGALSRYQSVRRAASAMLLHAREVKQEQLLDSEDVAIRCGAYVAGKFAPDEMKNVV